LQKTQKCTKLQGGQQESHQRAGVSFSSASVLVSTDMRKG